jgi:ribosomal-protein-alanine N-acetyltransferase
MDIAKHKPGSEVRISTATWRDLTALHQLERACFQSDAWPIWDILGVLTFPNIIRLKAEVEQRMVGFIGADLRYSKAHAWIVTFGVLPEYQRQGIGTSLLEACEKAIPLPKIKLSVRHSNQPALNLYRKFGYREVEVWPSYYEGKEDALVLEKDKPPGEEGS